jgi:hypothetical protein
MEEYENIFDKIKELLGSLPSQMTVLEEKISIDTQLEYFELSRQERKNTDPGLILQESVKLFDPLADDEEKKLSLVRIASVGKVDAYRLIEKFVREASGDIKNWGCLALQENRMLLESILLDENHVFISTGLGGKGQKLRYFVVLFGKDEFDFTELQQKIIRTEFEICFKKYRSELEQLNFSGSLANMLAVIPMNIIIKQVFTEAIRECNTFGNFLKQDFIVTNVKELSFDEIREYVKNHKISPGGSA